MPRAPAWIRLLPGPDSTPRFRRTPFPVHAAVGLIGCCYLPVTYPQHLPLRCYTTGLMGHVTVGSILFYTTPPDFALPACYRCCIAAWCYDTLLIGDTAVTRTLPIGRCRLQYDFGRYPFPHRTTGLVTCL